MTSALARNGNGGGGKREQNGTVRTSEGTTLSKAIAADVSHLLGRTTGGTTIFSEPELRKEFTALVLPFSARQLSKFTDATPEGARHWLDGTRCPNLANTVNIAQSIPTVRDWVALRCGIDRVMQAKSWDAWLQGLYAIAAGSGPDAEKARWAIARLTNEVTTETILKDALTVIDRREAKAVAVEKEKSTPRRRA